MSDSFPQKVIKKISHNISITEFGVYAISITARCQGKDFLGIRKEQNLRVEINDRQFREIPPEKNIQLWKIPVAWNGTKLKGLSKTVVLILPLNVEDYVFNFFADSEAVIEKFEYKPVPDFQNITFDLNERAEDGDRRPWYTFAFILALMLYYLFLFSFPMTSFFKLISDLRVSLRSSPILNL